MCRFLPALEGDAKMSTTGVGPIKAVFMSDTPKQIKKKINKYGFSGGQDTMELHRIHGGNTEVDVAFQWLRHFLEDDDEIEDIKRRYESGELLTGELKKICIGVVSKLALEHQERRDQVTPEVFKEFCSYGDIVGYDNL